MFTIYKIEDINDLIYIGKTKNNLIKRFCNHKCEYRNHYGKCSSHKLNLYNCIVTPIEINLSEEEAIEREAYYIQNTECVNKNQNICDSKIYHKRYRSKPEKRELEKKSKQIWYEKNHKEILEKKRNQNKIKWYCEICNCHVCNNHKSRHLKTLKHLNNL